MKVVILDACIEWQERYDEKGRPICKLCNQIGVLVSWMPFEISYNKYIFHHLFSGEYAGLMRREPQQIEMMVDYIARHFANAAAKLMEQNHLEPPDMSEACEELRRGLPYGFRSFLENGKIWIHHFNHVLNVPKGSRYRAEDGN